MLRFFSVVVLTASFTGCGSETSTPLDSQSLQSGSTIGATSVAHSSNTTGVDANPGSSLESTSGSNIDVASSSASSTGSTSSTNETVESGSNGDSTASQSTVGSTSATSSAAATTSDSSEATTSGEPAPSYPTSAELLAACKLGWNLGNSLDVPGGETDWGNPAVTPQLLQAVADAGFDIVRVPVTWSLFTGPGPDFAIDAARMTRVQEVIQYAFDAGLHVIINLHHDGADEFDTDGVEWLRLNNEAGAIDEANNAAVEARFRAVWTQIAEHFKAYDGRLLFESMNEIHDGYDAPDPGYYAIINHLNQVFIDIVRGSGGGNTQRHLVVPGYNTNIDYTLEGFVAPNDPTPNHLILSVHFYDPWSFAGAGESAAWGEGEPGADSWGQEDHVVTQFERLESEFIDQGLPMIIGEYGAVNVEGQEQYRRYYMEYVTQAACQHALVPSSPD